MPDLLARGAELLAAKQSAAGSRPVRLVRGGASVTAQAVIGQTTFQVESAQGVAIDFQSRDYLIPAASLVLDGQIVSPREGDLIIESDGGQDYVYEVLAVGTEPAARYSGLYRSRWRIHTKLVRIDTT